MPQIVYSLTNYRILMLSSLLANLSRARDEQICSCYGNIIFCQVCLSSKYNLEKNGDVNQSLDTEIPSLSTSN